MSVGEAPRAIRDEPKPTTGSAFGPFRHPAFTVIWTASIVANIGTWMYTATSGWLMTNLDPDPLTVSLVQVVKGGPRAKDLAWPPGATQNRRCLARAQGGAPPERVILSIAFSAEMNNIYLKYILSRSANGMERDRKPG